MFMKSAGSLTRTIIALTVVSASLMWPQGIKPTSIDQESKTVEKQIEALHEQHRMAALKGDPGFSEKYLAADYLGSGADGRLITKEQEIQMLRSGAVKYEAIDERDVQVRVYGDTAIVSALASVKMSVNRKPVMGDHRVTFVWVKQEGNWKLTSFQATRVAPMVPRPGNNLGHDARPATP
jgi:hypothetical protein